ncbi:histone-lysine N-methyltransferase PRDM9-like isoform X2 [Dermacentor albipictus]|uniref:histone-lysine N-methyltransferase PRDM9-like isoform X2 n=1 Tax=Dermacentor albipictus TaxID=60249 RepID=UPI0038FD2C20
MTTKKDFDKLRENVVEYQSGEPGESTNVPCAAATEECEAPRKLVFKRAATGEAGSSKRPREDVKHEPLSEDGDLWAGGASARSNGAFIGADLCEGSSSKPVRQNAKKEPPSGAHPLSFIGADLCELSRSKPVRQNAKKEPPSGAHPLLCDDCRIDYPGDCPIHGPLTHIKDTYVSIGDPQRANKTLPDGLSIRRTTLKGTQYGVFATKPLPKRIFFGPYEGVRRETLQMPETRFLRKVHTGTKGRQVDGRPLALSNWMRYVNSAPAGQDPNLVAFERAGAIYYRTCKAVGAFEELLLLDETADTRKSSASGTQKKDSLRPREVFSCTKCGDCFSSQMYLERHDRHHHTERPQGAHSCSTCSYSTNQRWRLDQHSLTHTGERPYVCEICKKDFTWRTDLNVHLLAHTQERPYECPECGERFNCPSHLQRHKKMHSRDPRPHVCPDCGKCYARKDYLKVHLLTHVAERRYECAECGRKFADPSNARHHYLFVHAKQYPLSCPHCGKGFASRRDVRRHVRARHDGQED